MTQSPSPTPAHPSQGTFKTPSPDHKSKSGSGVIKLNSTSNSKWLKIHYEEGAQPLVVKNGKEEFHMAAGSEISLHIIDSDVRVELHHQDKVTGHWAWQTQPDAAN